MRVQFKKFSLPGTLFLQFATLVALSGFLFFYHADRRDLWSSHEARAAQDAQTILDSDRWGMPELFAGQREMQKPPLYYWLVALSAKFRGSAVNEWDERLPAAATGLACVLIVYVLVTRRGRPLAGFVAAAMLASAVGYTWLARVGRIDMPLTFSVTAALGAFYVGRKLTDGRTKGFYLFLAYLALSLGVLFKGPIGLVLPLAVAGPYLLLEREIPLPWQFDRWRRLVHGLGLWWGVPLFLALTTPWYWWANTETDGEFFRVFFWHHNVERGLGSADGMHARPWWFYLAHLASNFLPWSPLLPVASWVCVKRGWWRVDAELRFGMLWLITITGLLSCMQFKRADYLLPAFPGAALALGCFAERAYAGFHFRRRLAYSFGIALLGCVLGWWYYVDYYLPRVEPTLEHKAFASEIRKRAPAPEEVVFFRTEAHNLAWRLGRPLRILVQWPDLDTLVAAPEPAYVVMPVESAKQWQEQVRSGYLDEVIRNTDLTGGEHDKPMILFRTRSKAVTLAR